MGRRDIAGRDWIYTHSYQRPGKNYLDNSGILPELRHDPEQQRLKIHGSLDRIVTNKIRPKLKAGLAPSDKG